MLGNHADQFMTTPMRTTVVTQNTARTGEMPAPRPGAHNSNTVEAGTVPHPSKPQTGMMPGMAGLGMDAGMMPGMDGLGMDAGMMPGMDGLGMDAGMMPGMDGLGFFGTLTPTQKMVGGVAIAGAVYYMFLRKKPTRRKARRKPATVPHQSIRK